MHADNRTLNKQMRDCIEECFRCAQTCEECSDHMIGMEHSDNMQMMAYCIRLCRECADICAMAGQWMSRLSPLAEKLCALCAEVCVQCAEACEQHKAHHTLCGPCAEECRRCAKACRQMTYASSQAA